MTDFDWDEWEKQRAEKEAYANAMNDKIIRGDIEGVGLDEKDWIILRLLFALYKEGRNASEPDAQRIVGWFNRQHEGYGQQVMLAAFSRLAGENRLRKEKKFSPYWKEGKWE